jgi:hypothetical protein
VRLFFDERNKEARTAEEARELGNNTISGPSCSYSFSTHLTEISLGDDDDDDDDDCRCRRTFWMAVSTARTSDTNRVPKAMLK